MGHRRQQDITQVCVGPDDGQQDGEAALEQMPLDGKTGRFLSTEAGVIFRPLTWTWSSERLTDPAPDLFFVKK